jgi:XTP/dITP diphosphohydrolase
MNILIATTNSHKLREIREILSVPGLSLVGMDSITDPPEVVEDAETFAGNAIKKAATLARVTGLWTMADDSGLSVEALDGRPGVRSARYAGEPVSYDANNRKLLAELRNATNRRASFHCAIALSDPSGNCRVVEGVCSGAILLAPRGSQGFGYDPLFVPDGHSLTFAEMEASAKHTLSHRGRALAQAHEAWIGLLSE